MRNNNTNSKKNLLKFLVALLLIGVIVFAGLPTKVEAGSPGSYNTNFDWDGQEEAEHEWPLPAEPALAKTRTGIGTAGFAYSRFYYNDEGRIVLEIDFSIFPDPANNESSNSKSFRDQWKYANLFIDPDLAIMVDDNASFFMMSYPLDSKTELLSKATKSGAENNALHVNNIYKLDVKDVYPKMPTSDYMKSKLYLVLKSTFNRDDLNQDYALQLRYTNNQNQIYEQRGSLGKQVLGSYYGHIPEYDTFDVTANNDNVTLKTVAPFHTASMPGAIPNPVLPPDMMRTVGQAVIYDNVQGKLHVYYKVAPNHYIYRYGSTYYANNGYFLSSWIGIRQVMDSRIFNALKPDENGVVGQMKMFDLNGEGSGWNVTTYIKADEFDETPVTADVSTYSYMLVPSGFKTDMTNKAIVPPSQTNNVKNVYLHGYRKEADYVRFIYDVDKNKMDEIFASANSSTLSISTSYITDRPTETTQTEYRLEALNDIVIPKGAKVVFEVPKTSRSVFKTGSGNNYERTIGDLETRRPANEMNQSGVDPSDYGKAYTITPYVATEGGYVLTMETGLTVPAGEPVSLTMFDSSSPATVTITVVQGTTRTSYTLNKYKTDENRILNMPNASVRSGIIINRSANTPHVNAFYTDDTEITGHSKYPGALVSVRKAADEPVFKEAYSYTSPSYFLAEGNTLTGYTFTLDVPATISLKKDMPLWFSNAAAGYFRSIPSIYRTQARVYFDHGTGITAYRIVPVNQKTYGETGYAANGFEGPNILWLDAEGNDVPASAPVKYLSNFEGKPITNTSSGDYKLRQFYSATPTREGYTFLGWSTKQVDSMSKETFDGLPELTNVSGWGEDTNYRFTATSPVDESRRVYAVWERDIYQYNIVLHSNNGKEKTHTVELPLSVISGGTGELTAYLKETGILHDTGFGPGESDPNRYFVGWSETLTVDDGVEVHQLYTNGSKVRIDNGSFQLQQNEEPKDSYPDGHSNPWKSVGSDYITKDNGIATINLYAQYKPMIKMTAAKKWYGFREGVSQKGVYENWVIDPENNPQPQQDAPHFLNSEVAMVLIRTTEGKTMDPTKYEIIEGFYEKGKDSNPLWQWAYQEGHDANGRKYSYLMTEFQAQDNTYTEENIINHFNNKRTWASLYITMLGNNDNLSKWTAMTLRNESNDTRSYLAVATSNQPDPETKQYVNSTVHYHFELKNFEVNILPPIINRIQTNHNQILIDIPMDNPGFLYVKLSDSADPILFSKNVAVWESDNPGYQLVVDAVNNKLVLTSSDPVGDPLTFADRKGQKVYALFTLTNTPPDTTEYAWRIIQDYDKLEDLEEAKQEPHIKDENGDITHNVISAKIPAGSYAGAKYTLGQMIGNSGFVSVKYNGSSFVAIPDDTGKLTFKVPAGILGQGQDYIFQGEDPADTFALTNFVNQVVSLDLTSPIITTGDYEVKTGDAVFLKLTASDYNATTLSYSITKGGEAAALPEGITYDPAANKFTGKTADVLPDAQLGDYTITIRAEDVFGNVSTKNITFTISQKPTTAPITKITQIANDAQGNAQLVIEGKAGARLKFYSEEEGYTEIFIPGLSGSWIKADGTKQVAMSQADVKRFNGGKVYVTQQEADKFESDITDVVGDPIEDRAGSKVVWNGGAVVIDNVPPVPIQMVVPKAGTNVLKIANATANHSLPDVKDIDRIVLDLGDGIERNLVRLYDGTGQTTGVWKCNNDREFTETEEEVTVVVNPNTGETATRTIGVLNFVLAGDTKFTEFQVITATYYDYLGNGSPTVTTSVPKLPEPVAPYDVTAINGSQAYPDNTVIEGKADPGAVVSVTIDGQTYNANVNELGEFTLIIPKQDNDKVLTVTSKLNNYTADGTTTVQTDPNADPIVIPVGTDINSPIPENYVRIYFAPTNAGWLKYNPTFNTGDVIAFDVRIGTTWAEAVANGLAVPTATPDDAGYEFDKWTPALLSADTVLSDTTAQSYYFVASYKKAGQTIVITGELPQSNTLATIFIVLGVILVIMTVVLIIMRKKAEQDKK